MKTVKDILLAKGHETWRIPPDASVFQALQLMAEKDVGALLVMEGEDLCGVFSERDYAREIVLAGKTSRDTPVREIMTPEVIYVTPDRGVEECMAVMTENRVRHLPVLEENRLVGLVSIGDVVKAIISGKEFVIDQLEKYVRGQR
jgi:CBS domain-containing protein